MSSFRLRRESCAFRLTWADWTRRYSKHEVRFPAINGCLTVFRLVVADLMVLEEAKLRANDDYSMEVSLPRIKRDVRKHFDPFPFSHVSWFVTRCFQGQ